MPQESEKYICKACNKEFLILSAEQIFYQKKHLPFPNYCAECRHKRRLSLRNENKLYRIACGKCGKTTLSSYRPDSPYKIFCKPCYFDSLI